MCAQYVFSAEMVQGQTTLTATAVASPLTVSFELRENDVLVHTPDCVYKYTVEAGNFGGVAASSPLEDAAQTLDAGIPTIEQAIEEAAIAGHEGEGHMPPLHEGEGEGEGHWPHDEERPFNFLLAIIFGAILIIILVISTFLL